MSFSNALASNAGGSISGQPGPAADPLSLVNRIKDREKQDFQDKANFMSDLSIKQDRLRKIYSLDGSQQQQQQPQQQQDPGGANALHNAMNRMDPNSAINPMQKAELGIRQQQANTESQRVNQQGQMGQQALDIKTQQEQLNAKKEGDIKDSAAAKLQAKIDETNGKLTQAQAALEARTKSGQDTIAEHERLAKAVEERHTAEMALLQHRYDTLAGQHQQVIDNLKESKNAPKTTTTTVNPDGTQKTVNVQSGSGATEADPLGILPQ